MIGIDTNVLVAWELPTHPECFRVRQILAREAAAGTELIIAPQVFAEFVHIVSDPRRFTQPLDIAAALIRAEWWHRSVDVTVPPVNSLAFKLFFEWMRQHQLGRKRVLDTLMAATYAANGVSRILTLNEQDFRLFGRFEFVS